MSHSKIQQFATASAQLLTASALLAKKQAELATIQTVTLPKLYQVVGRKIAGLEKVPSALTSHCDAIRALEATRTQLENAAGAAAPDGLAAKAKHLAQQAAQKTAETAASVQLQAAYGALGKAAVERYGQKAVPKEIAAELATAQARVATLAAEIEGLQAASSVGVVTPRRILAVGGGLLAAVVGIVLLRAAGGMFGGFGAARANRVARDVTAGLKESFATLDNNLERTTRGFSRDGGRLQLERQLSQALLDWRSQAELLVTDIREDEALAVARSDETNRTKWQMLGHEKWDELKRAETAAGEELGDLAESLEDGFLRDRDTSDTTEQVIAAEIRAAMKRFQAACAEKTEALTRQRATAIASVKNFYLAQVDNAMKPALTDELLASIQSIRKAAEARPVQRDRLVFLGVHPDNSFGQYYLSRLSTTDVDSLPTRDMLAEFLACIASGSTDAAVKLRSHVMSSCRDLFVLSRAGASLHFDVDTRRTVLKRLPAMSRLVQEGSDGEYRQLVQNIAYASFAYPDTGLAPEFDDLVADGTLFPAGGLGSEAYALLVAGAWQGSRRCIDTLTHYMQDADATATKRDGDTFDQRFVVRLAGAVMASTDSTTMRETLTKVAGRMQMLGNEHAFRRHGGPYQCFLEGWFTNAGKAAFEETRRIYNELVRLGDEVSDDPLVRSHQNIEYGRIGPLLYLIRLNDIDAIQRATQLEKLAWQSERVALLKAFIEQQRLTDVPVDSLVAIVSDPWEGTKATTDSSGPRFFATRKICIDEWLLYARSLKQRDAAAFRQTMLDTVFGRTPLRAALREDYLPPPGSSGPAFLDSWSLAEAPVFPYRAWAAQTLVDDDVGSLHDIASWAWSDKDANAGMRILVACLIAAQKTSPEITALCKNALAGELAEKEAYTRGLLTAVAANEAIDIDRDVLRASDRQFLRGLLFAAIVGGKTQIAQAALDAMKYIGDTVNVSDVLDESSATKRWTPFDFLPLDEACERLEASLPDGLGADEEQIMKYRLQRELLWPADVGMVAFVTADDVRRITQNSFRNRFATGTWRTERDGTERVPDVDAANWSFGNWSRDHDPVRVRDAIAKRFAKRGYQSEDVVAIGRLLGGASDSSSADSRIDPSVIAAWEARFFETVWPQLVAMENRVSTMPQKEQFQNDLVRYVDRWVKKHVGVSAPRSPTAGRAPAG